MLNSQVATHLSHTLKFAAGSPIYWGQLEAFHWQLDVHRPVGFAGRLTTRGHRRGLRETCKRRAVPAEAIAAANAAKKELSYGRLRTYPEIDTGAGALARRHVRSRGATGPFFFARGPLVFVSTELAVKVVTADSWAMRELPQVVASGNVTDRELTWPWEDVYLGAALAHLQRGGGEGGGGGGVGGGGGGGGGGGSGGGGIAEGQATHVADVNPPSAVLMHLGDEYLDQKWGFCMAPSSLVWHMKTKNEASVERIGKAHEWAKKNHCAPPTFDVRCAAADWVACRQDVDSAQSPMTWRPCTTTFSGRSERRRGRAAVTALPHSCSDVSQDLLLHFYGRKTGTECRF